MENSKTIAFDLDGVLADFDGASRRVLGECNTSLFSLEERYPGREDEIKEIVHDPAFYLKLYMTPYAQIVTQSLKRRKYFILAVTSRPVIVKDATWDWIRNHGIHTDLVWFRQDKIPILKEYKPYYMIEDCPAQITAMWKAKIPIMIMDQPWNQNGLPHSIPRLYELIKLLEYLL